VKLPLPAGFKLTNAQHCITTFLGRMVDRNLVLTEVTHSEKGEYELTYTRSLSYPVNGHRQTTDAIKLENFWIFLLFAYLLLADWRFGPPPGEKMPGARGRPLGGGVGPPRHHGERRPLLFIARHITFIAVVRVPEL